MIMKKYYIVFDEYERGIIINALNDKRNALIKKGDIPMQLTKYC